VERKRNVKAWALLFRPWSYTATLVPFLVSAGFVVGTNASRLDWTGWCLGLLAGLFLQATVNLLNTWGDERSGVDDVPGAIRTTPQVHDGLVSMRAVFAAAVVCAGLGAVLGAVACIRPAEDGWSVNVPALAAGAVGILGATNYSTGVKFKYRGLGVPFVSFLMGPLETAAALALLKPAVAWRVLEDPMAAALAAAATAVVSLPVASLVGVIMHGNDMRDIPTDRAAGIVTFASRLGPRRALAYYRFAHTVPYATCALFFVFRAVMGVVYGSWVDVAAGAEFVLLPAFCLPLTIKTLRTAGRVYRENPESPPWRGLERASGLIHLVFGSLYALAWAV